MQEWHHHWLVEVFRVLSPGGLIKTFGGTRVFHRLAAAMETAGFEDIHIEALGYGSGFPKSHNIAVYMDRMLTEGRSREIIRKGVGNLNGRFADAAVDFVSQSKAHTVTTPEALPWVGWGTALKPAWEPVLVGRKP
jgi:site-specific DNA-methyltransferase (adenine-specific)